MLKMILFIMMSLTLVACSSDSSKSGSDGYYMEPVSRIDSRPVVFNLVPSDRAVLEAYKKTPGGRQLRGNEELFGFTVISKEACTITIVDPAVTYRPEELGHEITHCLYGDFHPRQNEVRTF